MNDTITFYNRDRTNESFNPFSGLAEYFDERSLLELHRDLREADVGIKRFVTEKSSDHVNYHQDLFKRNIQHSHIQFEQTIDQIKFDHILTVVVRNGLISSAEKTRLLDAYHQANLLETAHVVYSTEEERFESELFALQGKVVELEYKADDGPIKYQLAAKAARELYRCLDQEKNAYFIKKNPLAYEQFKENCKKAIATARPVLAEYRGVNEILGNILLAVGLLGVGFLIAGLVNLYQHNRFLFFKTDSENKLNKVAGSLDDIPKPVADLS